MSALLYGFFACYAVTGKCDLRIDKEGHDIAVFASLADCQRFGSATVKQQPDSIGKWPVDEGHYYQCFGLTPVAVADLPQAGDAPRTVYKTTAEELQREFSTDPDGVTRKIGNSIVEINGTIINATIADGAALQLAGDTWDVTAWLSQDGIKAARGLGKKERVTLRCDRIGTLVAASSRRPAVIEVHDCKPVNPD